MFRPVRPRVVRADSHAASAPLSVSLRARQPLCALADCLAEPVPLSVA